MSTEVGTGALRHGAYLCIRSVPGRVPPAGLPVVALARRLAFTNEFDVAAGHPEEAFSLLRRVDATPGDLRDDSLYHAEAVVHAASPSADRVEQFCEAAVTLLEPTMAVSLLRGVVRPMRFTGGAMHDFAYAPHVRQQPAAVMPHAFILPTSKTPEWWAKGWMERHTYFLPRYDDAGRMLNEGHALAAASGIRHLMRRTYKHAIEPAPEGAYDFLNYFECADGGIEVFHQVRAALRDVARNPEWRFVREGPTWHGRRVGAWHELFD